MSRSVPASEATTDSVGGCEVPSANGDMAVSRMSTPASIAAWYDMDAIPEVECEWRQTGRPVVSLIPVIRSRAAAGMIRPAMSLMQIESAPRDASSPAISTKPATEWTGESVYEIAPCRWAPTSLTAAIERSMFRTSFRASKTRKISTPFACAAPTKRSTTSSG